MSYQKQTRFGQYLAVGDDDPWAEAASGEVKPVTGGDGSGFFDFLKPKPTAPATPKAPSTTSQIGSGIAAFLTTLGKPATPVPTGIPVTPYQGGMSTTTKLALAGGGALVLVLLLTRD